MVKKENQRPIGTFSKAVSAEIKGLMATHGITQGTFAKAIDRNQGYISERVNGLKSFDVDEIDTLASLIGTTGQQLLSTVSRRINDTASSDNVTHVAFGGNVGGSSDTDDIPENVEEAWIGKYAADPSGDDPIDHGTP